MTKKQDKQEAKLEKEESGGEEESEEESDESDSESDSSVSEFSPLKLNPSIFPEYNKRRPRRSVLRPVDPLKGPTSFLRITIDGVEYEEVTPETTPEKQSAEKLN